MAGTSTMVAGTLQFSVRTVVLDSIVTGKPVNSLTAPPYLVVQGGLVFTKEMRTMERVWFSNFYMFDGPMAYGSLVFYSVETFYQAMKTKDQALREAISKMTPSQAKRAGRKLDVRPDWKDIRLAVMEYALRHKFAKGTTWYRKLVGSTEELVETNIWHDNYWGVCQCCVLTQSPYGVRMCKGGQNHLGKILMRLRAEFQHKEDVEASLDPYKPGS